MPATAPRFCLPIQVPTIREAEDLLQQGRDRGLHQQYELWLDVLENPARDVLSLVHRLTSELGDQLMLLFRRPGLEPVRMSRGHRDAVLDHLDGGATLIDIDVDSQRDDLDAVRRRGLRIPTVLSYHNYRATPPIAVLRKTVERMVAEGADICKIATVCNDDRDALVLMEILLEMRERGLRYAVMGMGYAGRITRLYGALNGNAFNFAPLDAAKSSAPDQLTVDELLQLTAILRGRAKQPLSRP